MNKSLGFIEIAGVVPAVDCLDKMLKSADVELVTWEKKLGGRLVTVIISGAVSAVNEAVEIAYNSAIKKPVAKAVIPSPHEEIWKIIEKSKKAHKLDQDKTEEVLATNQVVLTEEVKEPTKKRTRKSTK